MNGSNRKRFIYILLFFAALYRIPAVWDGLPAVYNSTEYFLAKIALNMGARFSLDPLHYIYPTLYSYFLLVQYGCYFLVGKGLGFFPDQTALALEFLIRPTYFYLIGRVVNVILSLLTVSLTYCILEKYRGKYFAGLAAGMVAFSQCYIEFSGYATPDTLLILFSTLTVLFFEMIEYKPRLFYFYLQGVCCGLAIASKYNAGFLAAGILIAHFRYCRKYDLDYLQTILVPVSGIASGFFLSNPYWLIKPADYFHGFLLVASQMTSAVGSEKGINYAWEIYQLIRKEYIIGALFIGGTVFILWKEGRTYLPHLIMVLLTFLYVGSWQKKGIDYLLPLFPVWIIFGTVWLEHIFGKYVKHEKYRFWIIGFIFLPSVVFGFYRTALYMGNDTRAQAAEWIVQNHEAGTKYCYDSYHYDLAIFDIDRYLEYGAGSGYLPGRVKLELEKYREDKKNISLVPVLYPVSGQIPAGSGLYEREQGTYKRKTIEQLLAEGTDYLITTDAFYSIYRDARPDQYPNIISERIRDIQNFYEQLECRYQPIKVFSADFWIKGPEIKIYDLHKIEMKMYRNE